jgi:hypothetical protein
VADFVTVLGSLSFGGGASYATSTTTTVDNGVGFTAVKPGDRISLNATVAYKWSAAWESVARAGWTHTGTSRFDPPLAQPANGNGDIWRASLSQYYRTGAWRLGLTGSYLDREANEFAPSLSEFIPAKKKWELAGSINYRLRPSIRIDARVSRIWTSQDATPDLLIPGFGTLAGTALPDINQDAWTFTLGALIAFGADGTHPMKAGEVSR